MFVYSYTLSSDFGGQLGHRQFHDEIVSESGITTNLIGINVTGDVIEVLFESELSNSEKTLLDGLRTNHVIIGTKKSNSHFSLIPKVLDVNTASYRYIGSYLYPGSNVNSISEIKVLSYMDNGITDYEVRVYDSSNNNEIAKGIFSNTTESINTLGDISNLPSSETILEIQIRRNGGNSKKFVHLNAITIYIV